MKKRANLEAADGRKQTIRDALRQCILDKGYAATTLNDLAAEAGMASSHVLYYYSGKEDVLIDLYYNMLTLKQLDTVIPNQPDISPEEQCHALADYLFSNHGLPPEDRRVLVELLSLSLHNPSIAKLRHDWGLAHIEALHSLFEQSPKLLGFSTKETTLLAGAVMQGLLLYSCFDITTSAEARSALRKVFMLLGGFDRRPLEKSDSEASTKNTKTGTSRSRKKKRTLSSTQ